MQAVKAGGALLKERFGDVRTVSFKGKLNLVTDADHCSEEAIVRFLSRELPDFGILTEERQEVAGASPYRWILDPLDGTTNYAHGYPFFCVSLALEQSGSVIWGAVYDPLRDELFSAGRHAGALLNGSPVTVSETRDLERAMLCTGFPYDVHDSPHNNIEYCIRFLKTAQAVRRDGAAALDLCYVAAGRFDGFWEMKLNPWDIAAGILIVAEAGGAVSKFDGAPPDIFRGDILASNGHLHRRMVQTLAEVPCSV